MDLLDPTHAQVQRELFMRSFFDVPPPPELAELMAARMQDRVFAPGSMLFERGQPPGPIFFITAGRVQLEAPGAAPWLFEDRAFLGAIDANVGEPHPRSARALTTVEAIEIHFDHYLSLLEDFFDFAAASLIQGCDGTAKAAMALPPEKVLARSEVREPSPLHFSFDEPLGLVERLIVLRTARGFARSPVQPLVTLAQHAEELRFSPRQSVLTAGSRNRGLVLVAAGTARVYGSAPPVEGEVGPGELLQGIGALVPRPYTLNAEAATALVCLRIAHEDLFDAMEEHFGLARAWWAYMGQENQRIQSALAEGS